MKHRECKGSNTYFSINELDMLDWLHHTNDIIVVIKFVILLIK